MIFRLMRVTLATLLAFSLMMPIMTASAQGASDDDVNAAAVIVETDGEIGEIYLFDSAAQPGAACSVQPISSRLLVEITPMRIHRSPTGPSTQLIQVWVDAWQIHSDASRTLIASEVVQGRVGAAPGYVELGNGGIEIDAGYATEVVVTAEVIWHDAGDEPS
ncbi:MAG: hypothetical protein AB7G88_13355, partial [Thermomicrobiales bacterium]